MIQELILGIIDLSDIGGAHIKSAPDTDDHEGNEQQTDQGSRDAFAYGKH